MSFARSLFRRARGSAAGTPASAVAGRAHTSGGLGFGARLRWHRRSVAALLAATSALLAIAVLRPHGPAGSCGVPPPMVPVLVTTHDVQAGVVLTGHDVRRVAVPRALAPAGAVPVSARLAGRTLAAPMRAGEPVTDLRLVGPSLLAGYAVPGADVVAAPVRVADALTVRLVRPGDLVDVLAADPTGSGPGGQPPPAAAGALETSAPQAAPPADVTTARVVVSRSRVVLVPREEAGDGDQNRGGALVVLATTGSEAAALAKASASARLSLVLRPG
jgi:Flp pilus assembly protein CpaB